MKKAEDYYINGARAAVLPKSPDVSESTLIDLLAALKPFAESFAKIGKGNVSDNTKYQRFLDSNQMTPQVSMGDFRRAWKAYVEYS